MPGGLSDNLDNRKRPVVGRFFEQLEERFGRDRGQFLP
jgi:hypothetical protein